MERGGRGTTTKQINILFINGNWKQSKIPSVEVASKNNQFEGHKVSTNGTTGTFSSQIHIDGQ